MTIPSAPTPIDASPLPGRLLRLDRDRFDRMVAAGIFAPDDRVELRDGVVVVGGDIPYRLSLAQYGLSIERGILGPDDHLELLEGRLIAKMPSNPPHKVCTHRVFRALDRALPPGWHVAMEAAIRMPLSDSAPEPDVRVTRRAIEDYLQQDPGPEDVALVVEVADTSIGWDRKEKKRLYASEGIASYWIVNLRDNRLEAHADPEGGAYRSATILGPDEEVPLVIEGVEVGRVAVRDLLPWKEPMP